MYSIFIGHSDTITTILDNKEELICNNGHVSIKKLCDFDSPCIFFAIWLDKINKGNYYSKTLKAIDFFHEQIKKNEDYIGIALDYLQMLENKKNNKISAFLSIEGGEAIEGDLNKLNQFYNLGVRLLTLTWNYSNEIGNGALSENLSGLTPFGKDVVREMNKLNMIVDVSHLNEEGFWDVFEISEKPFVASHSNCFNLCPVKRNLKDQQIKAIAEKKGVIGINFCPDFICQNETATIDHILKHIDYILNLVGEDFVALGSDFDGIERLPSGMSNITCVKKIIVRLNDIYGEKVMMKISEKNFTRVVQDCCN